MSGWRWQIRLGRSAGTGDAEPPSLAARLLATLIFGFFLGMGLLFLALIGREAWRGAETFDWAERRCEILHSQVVRKGGEEPYRPEVAFRTLDDGPEARGDRIQRREIREGSHGAAAAHLAPYPVGARSDCFVSRTGEAVLERGPLWIALWALLPGIFVVIGGGGIVLTWRARPRDRLGRPLPEALGDGAGRRRPGRVLVGLGCVFALLGGVVFFFVGARPLWRVQQAQSWDRQLCTVEHSSVVSHSSDDGTTYSVDILYRWERGRGVERSSRYSFFGGSSSGRAGKAEIVRAHPVGAEVACWVDPERRNEAVLVRGLTPIAFAAAIPLAFLVAGLVMIALGRRRRARRSRLKQQLARGASDLSPDDPVLEVLPHFESTPGPVVLASESSRWGRLLGMTAMTLFWNGIVAVFAWQAWEGFERGRPDWFLVLFLVPFLLAGVGFCLGIVYRLLALRNPRPKLVASAATAHPGGGLELRWELAGAVGRLSRLRIALVGREQATYQVGTRTHTATETFLEETVVELPAPMCQLPGQATVAIPATAMHSFESAHNQIQWRLELVGEVERWPDVAETYPLVVLPRVDDDDKPEEERSP
jgi:hypothetical protein